MDLRSEVGGEDAHWSESAEWFWIAWTAAISIFWSVWYLSGPTIQSLLNLAEKIRRRL